MKTDAFETKWSELQLLPDDWNDPNHPRNSRQEITKWNNRSKAGKMLELMMQFGFLKTLKNL